MISDFFLIENNLLGIFLLLSSNFCNYMVSARDIFYIHIKHIFNLINVYIIRLANYNLKNFKFNRFASLFRQILIIMV